MPENLRQLGYASGFSAVLMLPGLIILGVLIDEPFLAFGTVMLVFPLSRLLFGAVSRSTPTVQAPWLTAALDHLPMFYCASLVFALAALGFELSTTQDALDTVDALGWALSLWMLLVFATCVSHALLHSAGRGPRLVGQMLAGVAGYPILGCEHVRHHRLSGNTDAAEWPRLDENVWGFARRRFAKLAVETMGPNGSAINGDPRCPAVRGLRLALGCTVAMCAAFLTSAGWVGLAVYLGASALVCFSIQLVTYMQHWGLGDDVLHDARVRGHGWDSDCRFQAWLTMGLSLHQNHHDAASKAYYQVRLAAGAPRHPAGYVILMLAALIPSVWRQLMLPVRDRWLQFPAAQPAAGRSLSCIGRYK